MITYYERFMSCGCGYSERQTAKNIPLDNLGKSMALFNERNFKGRHNCRSQVNYSEWKRIVFDTDYYLRYHTKKNGGIAKWKGRSLQNF